jgi:hypothetical protein
MRVVTTDIRYGSCPIPYFRIFMLCAQSRSSGYDGHLIIQRGTKKHTMSRSCTSYLMKFMVEMFRLNSRAIMHVVVVMVLLIIVMYTKTVGVCYHVVVVMLLSN